MYSTAKRTPDHRAILILAIHEARTKSNREKAARIRKHLKSDVSPCLAQRFTSSQGEVVFVVMTAGVRTTCPYCGVGCGIVATPDGKGGAAIAADHDHPANRGRLCSKGAALGETLSLEDRLLHPEIDGQRVSWEVALDTVANGFRQTIERHGPDAVAFYVSGQLLTEDYYAANKLIKGFFGPANIDTH